MTDSSYQTKVYERQGGDELVVANGGKITLESGAIVDAADWLTANLGTLTVTGVATLATVDVSAFTTTSLHALSTATTSTLTSTAIAALTTTQLGGMTTTAISTIASLFVAKT